MGTDASTVPVPGALVPPRRFGPRPQRWEVASARGLGVVGALALLLFVLLNFGLVVAAAERAAPMLTPPSRAGFPHWMAGPLRGLWPSLTKSPTALKWDFSLALGAMYLCYLLVLLCAHRIRVRWAIAAVVLLHVIYLLSPPLSLTDVFNYLNYGRMGFVHHLNPYTQIPVLEPHGDPSYAFSNWHHLPSPYGPLFTLYTYALAPLGVAASFWVLKASLAIASLAALWLVWRCAELLGRDPLTAVLFVGLNPVVLVWGLGGDHNDFFVVFWIMLGLYLLLAARASRREQPTTSWATRNGRTRVPIPGGRRRNGPPPAPAPGTAMWRTPAHSSTTAHQLRITPATSPGLFAPAPADATWPPDALARQRLIEADDARRSRRLREVGAGVALVTAVAIKASAGILLPIVLLGGQRRWRLLAGILAGGAILAAAALYAFGPHLPNLVDQTRLVAGDALPNVIGYSLGLGGETQTMHDILTVVVALTIIVCCAWAWRTRDWLRPATTAMLVLLLTLSWELPWYIYWVLPLAALVRSRALRSITLVFGLYLLLAWIPLTTDLISSLNFQPNATPLGEQNSHLTKRLLH